MNNRIHKVHWSLAGALAILTLAGCSERTETPTKGTLTITVDESVYPAIEEERKTFEDVYKQADITIGTAHAREAIAELLNDSVSVIVSSRPLNAEEREVQKKYDMSLGEHKIAIDGIAIIVHPSNPIAQLRTTQLDSILRGFVKRWPEAGWKGGGGIDLILPSRNSGPFEMVVNKLPGGGEISPDAKVIQTTPEIISFVSRRPASMGLVGMCWYRQKKDSVKAIELDNPSAPDSLDIKGRFFGPHQAYLYQKFYPFPSEVYIYSRADRYGVAAGFIAFMTSAPGQKIMLNSGLVPATMPVRIVELTTKGIQP